MSVVFRSLVDAYVQPGHASPCGAEPDGRLAKLPLHGLADIQPQCLLLCLGGLPDKGGQMGVARQLAAWARDNKERIITEIRKRHDSFVRWRGAKMLGERCRV